MSVFLGVDLENQAVGGVSLKAGATINGSSEILGTAVDMGEAVGLTTGIIQTGDVTGTPTTVALALKLVECNTSGGTYTDIPNATLALAAHASANNALLRYIVTGLRSKRYVKVSVTPTFVAGTSPTQPMSACVVSQKQAV